MNLSEIAEKVGGEVLGDPHFHVRSLTSFKKATADDIVILFDASYESQLTTTKSKTLISAKPNDHFDQHILVKDPRGAFYILMNLFYADWTGLSLESLSPVHQSDIQADPSCRVGQGTTIGADSVLYPHVVIGSRCKIGKNVTIYPNVTVYDQVEIGDHSIIHSGTVIGSDGFGYFPQDNKMQKVPHVGRVLMGAHCEVGGNACIDRGCLDDTIIGEGVKIDNGVHIAHNCQIGDHCAFAAQVGFAGRAKVEDWVQIGGQTGVNDVVIGKGTTVASRSGVTKDIPPFSKISGFPAWSHMKELKFQSFLRKLFLKS